MDYRTMLKISVSQGMISLRTVSRKRESSGDFMFPEEKLELLETDGKLLLSDRGSFADMQICQPDNGDTGSALQLRFTWLDHLDDGYAAGFVETIKIPCQKWQECMERSRLCNGDYQKVLSIEESRRPRIIFCSKENLREVSQRKMLRRKLGKFLDEHFNWYCSEKILVTDASCPYSFFFEEYRKDRKGICGGIILHGQENLKKAYYGIHT